MLKNILFFLFFLLATSPIFAESITHLNYKTFIGEKIKFEMIDTTYKNYKIANKKFNAKKYAGRIFSIEDIKLDKKGNLILFLATTLNNKKEKKFKIKTKTTNVELENISVLKPQNTHKIRTKNPIGKQSSTKREAKHSIVQNNFKSDFNDVSHTLGELHAPSQSDANFDIDTFFFMLLLLFSLIAIIVGAYKNNFQKKKLLEEVTDIHRGEPSEQELIIKLRQAQLPAENIFHDLYIPIGKEHFSQIDLVLVTDVGLIVFEVKDYSGWIFGNGKQQKWTQVLNYGKDKYRFYNPIMQNQHHINRLKTYLGQNIPCFSVIIFYGDCTLKDISFIPQNTYIATPASILATLDNILKTHQPFSYTRPIIPLLKDAVHNANDPRICKQHIDNIQKMLGNDRIFH